MIFRAHRTATIVALAALTLAACGGSSDSSSDTDTADTAAESTDAAPADTDAAESAPAEPAASEPDAGADTLPDGAEAQFRTALIDGFVSAGMSSEDAECVADGYEEFLDGDLSAVSEMSVEDITSITEECGVTL